MRNLAIVSLLLSVSVQSQTFRVSDVIMTDSTQSLSDPEIDWVGNHFCWAGVEGIWVGDIDKATGDFIPKNGKGVLVDPTPSRRGMQAVANGPEWAMSRNGSIVVYPDSVDATNICIGTARLVSGQWTALRLPSSCYRIPFFGSYDETYEKDGISCASYDPSTMTKTGTRLRNSSDTTEITPPDFSGNRWIKGMYAVSLSREKSTPYAVGIFDVTTETYTQVATFADPVDQSWIVPMPERGGAYVLWCVEKKADQEEIAVYLKSGSSWSKIDSFQLPTDRKEIFYTTTEPVIYYTENRSGTKIIHKCATGLSEGTAARAPAVAGAGKGQEPVRSLSLNLLHLRGVLPGETVDILDMRGRCLLRGAATGADWVLDLSSLSPGSYAVRSGAGVTAIVVH